jgi:hypothetical protein
MEETVRQELLAKTKQALDTDDWNTVVRLWQPWGEIRRCRSAMPAGLSQSVVYSL